MRNYSYLKLDSSIKKSLTLCKFADSSIFFTVYVVLKKKTSLKPVKYLQ